jgi:hypothetical protein
MIATVARPNTMRGVFHGDPSSGALDRRCHRDTPTSTATTPASSKRNNPVNSQWATVAAMRRRTMAVRPRRPPMTSGTAAAVPMSRTSTRSWSRLPTAVPTIAAETPRPAMNAANAHGGSFMVSSAAAPAASPIAIAATARMTTEKASASPSPTAPRTAPSTGKPGRSGTAPVGISRKMSRPCVVTARVRHT